MYRVVSEATLHNADLMPKYSDLLEEFDSDAYTQVFCPAVGFVAVPSDAWLDRSHSFWDSEECNWLMTELFDSINDALPENHVLQFSEYDGALLEIREFDDTTF